MGKSCQNIKKGQGLPKNIRKRQCPPKNIRKLKKRLITRSSMCGLLVKPQHIRFGTQIWQQSMKNVKNRSEIYEKMAVFATILP